MHYVCSILRAVTIKSLPRPFFEERPIKLSLPSVLPFDEKV